MAKMFEDASETLCQLAASVAPCWQGFESGSDAQSPPPWLAAKKELVM
eukprot:CAMPEP_0172892588 /NCGR_PEP_ID=MMETSP1075-20121228/146494_1 /TAXON_ID=2916 /ORGANISM="Ceratium fusus, Strain PA161109" /LENGTH=47 /DNA_ID= /DNA_START= /DNA_END= /DNA_ORIENTATION=